MARKSKIEYGNFITLKEGKKFGFGDANLSCKCSNPECDLLMDWVYTGDGVFVGQCCGQIYEMYCEAVTFKRIGKANRPDKSIRQRRRIFKVEVTRKPLASEEVEDFPEEDRSA